MNSLVSYLRVIVLLLAAVCIPSGIVTLGCATTGLGRVYAVAVTLFGLGPFLWCIGDERGSRLQIWIGQGLLALVAPGLLFVTFHAPDGRTPETARIHSRFAGGKWRYQRFSHGNLLPEIDQIRVGYRAAEAFDPLFTQSQLRDLDAMTASIYSQVAGDADFRACGSALPAIYDEFLGAEFWHGHYFHYIPPGLDRTKPSPTLVFLHGSGGNFKAYVWLLAQVADRTNCTIIAPTFGLGNWERPRAYDTSTNAIEDASRYAAVDPGEIHLMGLSNGGQGVCLAESKEGPKFRSLIFLSGVFLNRVHPEELAKRFAHRPILVISGGQDDRVPWSYVSGYATALASGGCDVTTKRFESDDHFLFFRQREAVLGIIEDWLRKER